MIGYQFVGLRSGQLKDEFVGRFRSVMICMLIRGFVLRDDMIIRVLNWREKR